VRVWNIKKIIDTFINSKCLNRTCEGLKLEGYIIALRPNNSVWIEPVRDWNQEIINLFVQLTCLNRTCEGLKHDYKPKVLNRDFEFESNLWGIETSICRRVIRLIRGVWIEPVRDWNINYFIPISSFNFSLNRTCEGLKLYAEWPQNSLKFLFESNLWGIETRALIQMGKDPAN